MQAIFEIIKHAQAKGGSNTTRNIELLCEKCNTNKSNNVA
jgi:5-methylcytosine-specific restriction endonuclease McrA